MQAAPHLELVGLHRRYGEVRALDGASLGVGRGEVMALLGPSGSGKSTLLAAVAGMVALDAGAIRLAGREIEALPPERRGLGMVFQDYALWPHMRVVQQVAYPLRRRGVGRPEALARAERALERVGLSGFGRRRSGELSGGQQQRVALARAVVAEPGLLLLDEPLSALDPETRGGVREELRQLLTGLGITTLLVTHDREDAFELADRVAVMQAGKVLHVGTPRETFERPTDVGVARFLGLALLEAEVRGGLARLGELTLPVPNGFPVGPVFLAVPPARLWLLQEEETPAAGTSPAVLGAEVQRRRYVDGRYRLQLLPDGQRRPITLHCDVEPVGDQVRFCFDPVTVHLLSAPQP